MYKLAKSFHKPNKQKPKSKNRQTIKQTKVHNSHIRCSTKYLTELQSVLFTSKLEITTNKDEHAARRSRGLAIDGSDGMFALIEGERSELVDNVLRALDLLTFKSQHGRLLVESR
ncbi:hypothetical protein Hanom_Chr06g00560611 [Helianthus anomalus]